jgi:hypothetical protein
LLQNRAILRNAARISFPRVGCEKHAAQHPEKLRKKPLLELQISRSEPTELCRRSHTKAVFSELIKSSS